MKILFEDKEFEEIAMSGGMCVTVPAEVSVYGNGENTITVFSRFECVAKEFVEKYSEDPLGAEAVSFLERSISPSMESVGYEFGGKDYGDIMCFTADENTSLVEASSEYEIVKIENNNDFNGYELPEEMVAELDDDDEADVYFAAVLNGKIISFAGINDLSDKGYFEINVETVEKYRGKGLGSSVASSLCAYLVSMGKKVLYCCDSINTASVRLAESIGLDFKKESRSLVYYVSE